MTEATSTHSVPTIHSSTRHCAPGDRLDYWRHRLSEYHDIALPSGVRQEDFWVESTLWYLGGIIVADAGFAAHNQLRDHRKIRRSGVDHYELDLQVTGPHSSFSSGRAECRFGPGELLMKDLGQYEDSHISEGRQIVIILGRDFLDQRLRSVGFSHGMMPRGPLAILLADHLRNLVACLHASSDIDGLSLAEATASLVTAVVANTPAAIDAARPQIQDALRRRILRYIDLNLENAELSQDHLCKTFHLSRLSLYRLFRALGGVASVIQARRLARIRQIMGIKGQHQHLGLLSERFGFSSQSQMSRAFRSLYGHAPSETEGLLVDQRSATTSAPALSLRRWMHQLV